MEKPICTIVCEDCGKFAVMHENAITIFLVNNEFFAVSRCSFCDQIITDAVNKETTIYLFWENVRIFNFNSGEQIVDQKVLEKI